MWVLSLWGLHFHCSNHRTGINTGQNPCQLFDSKGYKNIQKGPANFNCFEILNLFYLLAVLWGMWDISSLTRDQNCAPCIGSVESSPLDCQRRPGPPNFSGPYLFTKSQQQIHSLPYVQRAGWQQTQVETSHHPTRAGTAVSSWEEGHLPRITKPV